MPFMFHDKVELKLSFLSKYIKNSKSKRIENLNVDFRCFGMSSTDLETHISKHIIFYRLYTNPQKPY